MKKQRNKQRVLLVSEYFAPHWTGIAKAFFYLTKSVASQGHEVTVLTTQFDEKSPRSETLDEIRVVRSPYQFRISRTHYSFTIVLKFLTMVGGYDTVIINSPNSNILFYSIIAKLTGRKLTIYHQGDLTLPRQTGNQVMRFLMERVFDILTIPSFLMSNIASTYTRDYASNSRVMKYALYKFRPFIPKFELSTKKPTPAFKKKLAALKKNNYLVGFAGRFVEEKGYDVLMEAIPLVLKKLPNTQFAFAGKKTMDYEPFYEIHKKAVEKNKKYLTFLGLLHEGNLTHFYESLDLFALSSRSDCFPTTQIEVAQKKIPIVVTDIMGARMLVKETGFGEIVDIEDPQSLADGIVKVLKNKKKYIARHNKVLSFFKKYETFRIS